MLTRATSIRLCFLVAFALSATAFGYAQSFDCSKAATPYEKLICSNKDLSAADSQLASAYKAALAQLSPEGKQWLVRSQSSWLKHSRNTAKLDVDSLKLAYQDRIQQLQRPLEEVGPFKFQWITIFGSAAPAKDDAAQQSPDDEADSLVNGNTDYTFPRIESPATPGAEKWNLLIAKQVKTDVGDPDADTDISLTVTITYATADVISAFFQEESMSRGAAHPNHGSSGYILLLKSGRQLTADDLFNPASAWKVLLKRKMKAAAAKEEWSSYDGAESPEIDPSHWTISNEGLTLNFAPYEVDSYAGGPHELTVSWAELKPYLNSRPPFQIPPK